MTGVAEQNLDELILYGVEPDRLQTGVIDYNFLDLWV